MTDPSKHHEIHDAVVRMELVTDALNSLLNRITGPTDEPVDTEVPCPHPGPAPLAEFLCTTSDHIHKTTDSNLKIIERLNCELF